MFRQRAMHPDVIFNSTHHHAHNACIESSFSSQYSASKIRREPFPRSIFDKMPHSRPKIPRFLIDRLETRSYMNTSMRLSA